jgi:tetratricopeptide (TPR) repeat protein
MSEYFNLKADAKEAITYGLKAVEAGEKKKYPELQFCYQMLSIAYNDIDNPREALKYARQVKMLIDTYGNDVTQGDIYNQFADAFNKLHQPDSVLYYANIGMVQMSKHTKSHPKRQLMVFLGNAYENLGNYDLAESYYAASIKRDFSTNPHDDIFYDALTLQAYSLFLLTRNQLDKAKRYGLKAMEAAEISHNKRLLLNATHTLRKIYETTRHLTDSAYYFANMELAIRDSMFNQSKMNEIQSMLFNEQIRESEAQQKQAEEMERQKHSVQYAFIALALLSFIILFLLLSHSIIINEKAIRFLGVYSLLIAFEFVELLLHPFIMEITHHSPVGMLIIMVVIAIVIVPLHHKLEHRAIHKLVAKNKRIRLARAKKIIENTSAPEDL